MLIFRTTLAGWLFMGLALLPARAEEPRVTLLAGHLGGPGWVDGPGESARFFKPGSLATDASGHVYVADLGNEVVRKITPDGKVTTLGAWRKSSGGLAPLSGLKAIAVDAKGLVYAIAFGAIARVSQDGTVTLLAGDRWEKGFSDGQGAAARFYDPEDLAVDPSGNVYVADTGNRVIRKISPAGMVTTLAGKARKQDDDDNEAAKEPKDGKGHQAQFSNPTQLALTPSGNLRVLDEDIWRIVTPAGHVSTVMEAGKKGKRSKPLQLFAAKGMVARASGDIIVLGKDGHYQASAHGDWEDYSIQVSDPCWFSLSSGAEDGKGNLFFASEEDHAIYKLAAGAQSARLLAGRPLQPGNQDGRGASARFSWPSGVAADGQGGLWVADSGKRTLRKVLPDGKVSTVAGLAGEAGDEDGQGDKARFSSRMNGLASDAQGVAYLVDGDAVRKITPSGLVTTLARDLSVVGSEASEIDHDRSFHDPSGIAVDASGTVFVSSPGGHCILRITPEGTPSLYAGRKGDSGGQDGPLEEARFHDPSAMAVDAKGNLFVVEPQSGRIRRVGIDRKVTTLEPTFSNPTGVVLDQQGNLYVAEAGRGEVAKVTPEGQVFRLYDGDQEGALPHTDQGKECPLSGIALLPSGEVAVTMSHGLARIGTARPLAEAEATAPADTPDPLAQPLKVAPMTLPLAQELHQAFSQRFLGTNTQVTRRRVQGEAGGPMFAQKELEGLFEASVVPGSPAAQLLGQFLKDESEGRIASDSPLAGDVLAIKYAYLKRWLYLVSALTENGAPAGFGGPGKQLDRPDDQMAYTGDIWYMDITDLSDEQKASITGPDKPLLDWKLPPEGTLVRRVFPFLVFRREHAGTELERIRLEGVSKEFMDCLKASMK